LKASDVDDVVVEGKILMRSRRILTLDEARIKAEAAKYASKIRDSLR
jgi:5-methylthioadenosine/S-adenosylhomocysteine deaminase